MSDKVPSKKGKSKKKSQRSNGEANSQMVPYEDPEANSGRPQRPEQRISSRNGAQQRSSRNRPPPMDDDVSDVSDADYETNTTEEPQFKYSTAELNESGWRNGSCCIITMCVICIVVAIVLSVVMVKVVEKNDESSTQTSAPTQAGTLPPPPPPPPGTNSFQRPKESVDTRCSEENFQNDREGCEDTCAGFACCDPSLAEEQSCLASNQEGCLNYAKCHVLNDDIEPAPDNLHEICSPEALASDPSQCNDECQQLQCCWSDELSSCVSSKFYACLDYAPCQNLRSDRRVVTADPTIYDFCSESTGSVSQAGACEDACAPAECCWSEGTDNCLQSDFFSCLTYEPCEKLDLPPTGAEGSNVTAPPPTTDVEDVCSTLYINSEGTFDCETACSKGSCCVEGSVNNCFQEDPLGCLPYDSCKNAS